MVLFSKLSPPWHAKYCGIVLLRSSCLSSSSRQFFLDEKKICRHFALRKSRKIVCCDWPDEKARWRYLACSELPAVSSKKIVFFFM